MNGFSTLSKAILVTLLLLPIAGFVSAAEPVGEATQAIQTEKTGHGPVATGDNVFVGDEFLVGERGSMIILFIDESVLTLKSGSKATIKAFRMGSKGKPGMALIKATDGKYRYTPGKILTQGGVQYVVKDTSPVSSSGQADIASAGEGSSPDGRSTDAASESSDSALSGAPGDSARSGPGEGAADSSMNAAAKSNAASSDASSHSVAGGSSPDQAGSETPGGSHADVPETEAASGSGSGGEGTSTASGGTATASTSSSLNTSGGSNLGFAGVTPIGGCADGGDCMGGGMGGAPLGGAGMEADLMTFSGSPLGGAGMEGMESLTANLDANNLNLGANTFNTGLESFSPDIGSFSPDMGSFDLGAETFAFDMSIPAAESLTGGSYVGMIDTLSAGALFEAGLTSDMLLGNVGAGFASPAAAFESPATGVLATGVGFQTPTNTFQAIGIQGLSSQLNLSTFNLNTTFSAFSSFNTNLLNLNVPQFQAP